MKKENIIILGSTGSIGENVLSVLDDTKDKNIFALSSNVNIEKLYEQIIKYRPKFAVVYDENKYEELFFILKKQNINKTKLLCGSSGLYEIVNNEETDSVVNAMALSFDKNNNSNTKLNIDLTLSAIKNKKKVALANKETIVCAGKKIMSTAKKFGVDIKPIDSEHSAIYQCLAGEDRKKIKKIILTCSGGPFYGMKMSKLKDVSVKDCIKHPNWKMGTKICIDCATLVNKGLEVIEAHYLFDVPKEKIEVVIHRESIIHSMVEFEDGSIKAQMGTPSMKIPVSYALYGYDRKKIKVDYLDFDKIKNIHFDKVDNKNFKAIDLAYLSLEKGYKYPEIFCKSDEIAVNKFINSEIRFDEIVPFIESQLTNK